MIFWHIKHQLVTDIPITAKAYGFPPPLQVVGRLTLIDARFIHMVYPMKCAHGFAGFFFFHYNDIRMSSMVSQIASLMIVYSTVYSGADQRKHQSSVSLASVRGIHRWLVNSPHKGPVMRKMFPFHDIIMHGCQGNGAYRSGYISVTNMSGMHTWNRHCKLFVTMKVIISWLWISMITLSNGNIFHATGHLCEEFAGHRRSPRTKASDVELWCFLWSASQLTIE